MSNEIDAILDECLDRVKAGESIDSCLSRYPEHAEALEPLLQMAQAMELLRVTEPPRPAALARGRQRFLTEAARLREERARRKQSLIERLLGPLGGRRYSPAMARVVTAALATVLAFLIVSGVVVQAAANSLPGEPLYSVKSVTRQVQLLITLNPRAREEKQKQIEAQEREEVRKAAEKGNVFEMQVGGVIVEAGPGWVVLEDGLYIRLTNATVLEGTPVAGHIASVHVRSENGQLIALRMVVQRAPTIIVIAPPTSTPLPTWTPSPVPTPTPVPTWTPTPPPPVPTEPKPVIMKKEPTKTATPKPTLSPTATKTPGIPEKLPVLELTGRIESIDKEQGIWIISGQQIIVTSTTQITGEPAVGRTAHVQAELHSDGTFVALIIVVEAPPTAKPPERVTISGIIQERLGDNLWKINNIKVRVDDRTEVKGSLEIGYFAEVEGVREGPDQVYAERITARQVCDATASFEGVIESIDAEAGIWVVSGTTIRINDATQISGEPVVGAIAQVDICQAGDILIATHIFVVPPTPTFTPTPTPTQTPTPTAGSNLAPTPTSGTPAPTLESLPTPTPMPTGEVNPTPSSTPTPTLENLPTPTSTSGSNLAPTPTAIDPAPTMETLPTRAP